MLLIIIQGVQTGCSQNPSPGAPAAEVDTSEILVPWHSRDGSCEHPICTPCTISSGTILQSYFQFS